MANSTTFSTLEKEVIDLTANIKVLQKELDKVIKSTDKKVQLIDPKSSKDVEELRASVKALELALKGKQKAEQDLIKLAKEQEKLDQERIKTSNLKRTAELKEIKEKERKINVTKREEKAQERLNVAKQKAIDKTKQESTFLGKLNKEYNKAQVELKETALKYGELSKRTLVAQRRFEKLDKSLRSVNKLAKDGRRDVGRYGIATEGLGKNLFSVSKNLVGAFGVVGGIQLLAQGVKEAFNIVRDFSSAQSELAGILGVTKSSLTDLRDVIVDLGSSTVFTATEVTKASTELAKLGFTSDEISVSLKSVLDGAVAMGVSISESAELSSKTLRAFNLDANESQRVVSTLAVATTKTGLNFQFLGDSLPYASTGARLLGQSVEKTTAQLGVLADNGIKTSSAGTGLRKIFSTISKEGLNLDDVLKEINESTNKSATSSAYFGEIAKDVGIILAENESKINDVTKAITGQDEALEKLIETRLDNLDGDLKKLSSAWEGLILSFEDGEGVFNNIFRGAIQLTTTLLGAFTKTNKIISIFINKLSVEFAPITKLIKDLFGSFGDFNIKGAITETIIQKLVIGFKVLIAPIRLLFSTILLLKDSFSIVINEGKKFLNFLGGDFEINPTINVDNVVARFKDLKDIIVDTFTVDEIDTSKIENKLETAVKNVSNKIKDLDKNNKGSKGDISKEVIIDDLSNVLTEIEKNAKEQELVIIKSGKSQDEIKELLYQNDIERLKKLIEAKEKYGEKSIDLEIELARKINNREQEELDASLKRKEDAQKKVIELAEKGLDHIQDYINKKSEEKQKKLEEEIDSAQSAQNELLSIAEGADSQASQLASKRIQSEKRIEREKTELLKQEQEKQLRYQMVINGLKAVGNGASNSQALGDTVALMSLFSTIDLSSFDVGSDRLSTSGENVIDNKGGFKAIIHRDEKILTAEDNKSIDYMENSKLVGIAQDYLSGDLVSKDSMVKMPSLNVQRFDSNTTLINKIDELKHSIENQDYPTQKVNFDVVEGVVTYITKKKNKITTEYKKV